MFEPSQVVALITIYTALLFVIAYVVEKNAAKGRNLSRNPIVYSLSLAVYCTAWTYYGSVGKAVNSGLLFLTIYLGPTMAAIFWWTILRKMVRLKETHRITSIADFISSRYDKSQTVAALATVLVLLGITPYMALQLKAVINTVGIIMTGSYSDSSAADDGIGLLVVVLMLVFTLAMGVRRIDPTERHPGMVMAVAVESVVKLIAFVAVGIFVTYNLFDGLGDIFSKFSDTAMKQLMTSGPARGSSYQTWISYLVLAMAAIMFLPRQFHVAVVENYEEKHIRTAMWLFPLYMLLINIFVTPIAMGGLLSGYSAAEADTFVLLLPLDHGQRWLSLLVFLGGFSAAASMVMISSVTIATMVTNHLLLPIIVLLPRLGFLRRYLLQCRWAAVALGIMIGYWFARSVGEVYILVNIGIMSFAAALQFAPTAVIGGLYWRRANKTGAIMGLSAGFAVWLYTMILPAFFKSGHWTPSLFENGPWGLAFLAPERLFGLTAFDPISNTVFWSMFFNVGLFVVGAYFFEPQEQEKRLAEEFVEVMTPHPVMIGEPGSAMMVNLGEKKAKLGRILRQYLTPHQTTLVLQNAGFRGRVSPSGTISIIQLAELNTSVERALAGSIGAAAAHWAMKKYSIFTPNEAQALAKVYGDMLAGLHVPPEELKKKIDYYKEKEILLQAQAEEMSEKVAELEEEIANRKKIEAALAESERKFRGIFNQTFQFTGLLALDGTLLEANITALDIIKAEMGEIQGKPFWDTPWWAHSPEVREQIRSAVEAAAAGRLLRFETTNQTADGRIINIDFSMKPVLDEAGKPIYIIPEGRDITERKKAEEAAEAIRRRLLDIVDFLPDATFVIDEDKKVIAWNKAMEEMTGRMKSEIVGKDDLEYSRLFYGDNRPVLIDMIWEHDGEAVSKYDYLKKVGDMLYAEVFVPTLNNGQGAYVSATASPLFNQDGDIVGAIESVRDITVRKQAEANLRASEKRFRDLFNSITDFIYTHDLDGRMIGLNPVAAKEFGYDPEAVAGQMISEFLHPDNRDAIYEEYLPQLKREGGLDGTFKIMTAFGQTRYVEFKSTLVQPQDGDPYVSGVGRDITDRIMAQREIRSLEEQLFQAQKMEALGVMAGGIAHDFNNILGAILGFTELAINKAEKDSRQYHYLEQVLTAGNRAADLISHILIFSRQSDQKRQQLDVKPIIRETLRLLRASIPTSVEIRQEIFPGEAITIGHPIQIQQIILNLCTNAAQAISENGGCLTITLNETQITSESVGPTLGLKPGRYLMLEVIDTGSGIDPSVKERIFDPYFTTKPVGEGTGLGLATVHGIVKSYEGAITVHSEVGIGSRFTVYLPSGLKEFEAENKLSASIRQGDETILFVDDEAALVEMGNEVLQELGYTVKACGSSQEALEVFRKHPGDFDLVITDLTMPQINGLELAKNMIRIRADIPIILCTGFSGKIKPEIAEAAGIKAVLMKPLVISNLAETIRGVLDDGVTRDT